MLCRRRRINSTGIRWCAVDLFACDSFSLPSAMKILLIHPEDELQDGPWALQRWDRVIDLGTTGGESYSKAEAALGCRVSELTEFRNNFQELLRLRELLALGLGRLTDSLGLDWWELTTILFHRQLETAYLLRKLVETLAPLDEVHVTRPGFQADALRITLGSRLKTFSPTANSHKRSVGHYVRLLKKFPIPQLLEIFWDKTDPGYQFRGSLHHRRRQQSSNPVVLLPSSYVNVSRTALAYAQSLPETQFLLVVTRRSGWVEALPPNVAATWLSRYASLQGRSRKLECQDLIRRWELLRNELKTVPELRTLDELGYLRDFPKRFAQGLEIRDAWRNVLDSESVQAVICADDSNPYTHIPLLLAVQRGLPTIACHHGALDGRYLFKRYHADVLLAKGKMEEDYLVRLCGIPNNKVEIGAPVLQTDLGQGPGTRHKSWIVFFSEAYEMAGGRAKRIYQDILPSLADLALSEGRELIVKLHPSESCSERSRIIEQILETKQQKVTRLIAGPLQSEMLDQAWFGVTVVSTVAVECALQGIPCFLCGWLESWLAGYIEQFTRFGVGIRLEKPDQIRDIPGMLRNFSMSNRVRENCWIPIEPQRLRFLLGMGSGATRPRTHSMRTL